MKLYLTRHGQTDWNKESRAQGRADVPLNDTGRAQARELGEKIQNLQFDAVYSSPLRRAAETAQIAAGDKYDIIYDDRIMERSFGEYEGKQIASWDDLIEGVNIDDITLKQIPGNVETVQETIDRVTNFVDYLKQTYPDDAKILVVAHGSLARTFYWVLVRPKDEPFGGGHIHNAEIKEYEI